MEPMFNFRSLAEMMGREDEKENGGPMVEHSEGMTHLLSSATGRERGESSASAATTATSEGGMDESVATLKVDSPDEQEEEHLSANGNKNGNGNTLGAAPKMTTPELMVTPVTPAAVTSKDEQSKQLGAGMRFTSQETQ